MSRKMRLEKVVAAMPELKMTIYLTNSSKNFKAIYWRQSHNLQISTTFQNMITSLKKTN
jgi:hypothetical protein